MTEGVELRELQHAQTFNLTGETPGDVLRAAASLMDVTDATFIGFNMEYLPNTRFVLDGGSPSFREEVVPDSYRWVATLTLEDA